MKASELRIGNWVTGDAGNPYQFELCDFYDWWGDHNSHIFGEHIHPIPLTEEWLLKFGFEIFDDPEHYFIEYDKNSIAPIYFDLWGYGDCYYIDNWHINIKYAHQLQNLYFALTGEELTIK